MHMYIYIYIYIYMFLRRCPRHSSTAATPTPWARVAPAARPQYY